MSVIETKLNARSADFQANAAAMQALVDDLQAQVQKVGAGGGEAGLAANQPPGQGGDIAIGHLRAVGAGAVNDVAAVKQAGRRAGLPAMAVVSGG